MRPAYFFLRFGMLGVRAAWDIECFFFGGETLLPLAMLMVLTSEACLGIESRDSGFNGLGFRV